MQKDVIDPRAVLRLFCKLEMDLHLCIASKCNVTIKHFWVESFLLLETDA